MRKIFFAIFFAVCFVYNYNASAQWQQANGPNGGTVRNLIISGSNIFAAQNGQVVLTTDNGGHWTYINTDLYPLYVANLIASGPYIFAATSGGGVYRTANNGTNWTAVNSGISSSASAYALYACDTSIFLGTNSGLYVTTNYGGNWVLKSSQLTNLNVISKFGNTMLAAKYNAVYLSTDNGNTWTQTLSGLPSYSDIRSFISIGTKIFAGTDGSGLFMSTNNGVSWTQNTAFTSPYPMSLFMVGNNFFAGTLDKGVWLSTDNGTSWTTVNIGLSNYSISSFLYNGTNLYTSTFGGGVFVTSLNNILWNKINNGLIVQNVKALAENGTYMYSGTLNGVYHSSDAGSSWIDVDTSGSILTGINILAVNGLDYFAATRNVMYKSINNGHSWNTSEILQTNVTINDIAVNGQNIFFGTYAGSSLYRSTNNGDSWAAANTGIPANTTVTSLAMCDTNIFAGTNSGVYLSSDNGTTWTTVNNGLTNLNISNLSVSGTNLFALASNGNIYKTGNNGTSWINTGTSNTSGNAFATRGNNLFIATTYGIIFSTDNGANWSVENTGLPANTNVYSIHISNTQIYIGTANNGIWIRNLADFLPCYSADAMISSIITPASYYCTPQTISPSVEIKNWGIAPLTSLKINYQIDNDSFTQNIWTGNLATGSTETVILSPVAINTGNHIFKAYSSEPNSVADNNTLNDTILKNFSVATGVPLPLEETFFNFTFPPLGWEINNPDGSIAWTRIAGSSLSDTGIAKISFWSSPNGQIDDLIVPSVSLLPEHSPVLTFKVAYAQYNSASADQLSVQVSTDCVNWSTVWTKSGTTLATAPVSSSEFTPTATQWRTESVGLCGYAGVPSLRIRFHGVSNFGNCAYIDDIKIKSRDIAGTVNYSGGVIPQNSASVELYKKMNITSYKKTDSVLVTGNTYHFSDVETGVYLVHVKLDSAAFDPNIINTYYDSASVWYRADTINATCDTLGDINIHLFSMTTPAGTPTGIASGNIYYWNTGSKGPLTPKNILLNNDPVKNADVYVDSEPGNFPVARSRTDSDGYYSFTGLPEGQTYKISVDVPGLPLLSSYTFSVTSNDFTFSNLNFFVDTSETNGFITNDTLFTKQWFNQSPAFSVLVYPNPVRNILNIDYILNKSGKVSIELIDAEGKNLFKTTDSELAAGNYKTQMNISKIGISAGSYFIKFTHGETVYLKKIIIN